MFVLDMKDVDVSGFQQNSFLFPLIFSRKRHVIALHVGWTCCFQDKDFFDTTFVHDGIIEVLTFAIIKNIKKLENFKIYLMPTEIFHSRHTPRSKTLNTFDVYYLLAFKIYYDLFSTSVGASLKFFF